ncbi:MAG: gliding motility-associated C-terminal domain-containing protein, partial [Bacteroidota bacterium]
DNFYLVMNSIQFFEINIFDRWGRLVYRSNNPDFKWDGTLNGTPVQEGVYVYRVKASTFRGENIERSGSITLVR